MCGSTLSGDGVFKIYSLASKVIESQERRKTSTTSLFQGVSEVAASNKRRKALRCGTFHSSSTEERHLVTGDFGGGLAVWDLEEVNVF